MKALARFADNVLEGLVFGKRAFNETNGDRQVPGRCWNHLPTVPIRKPLTIEALAMRSDRMADFFKCPDESSQGLSVDWVVVEQCFFLLVQALRIVQTFREKFAG